VGLPDQIIVPLGVYGASLGDLSLNCKSPPMSMHKALLASQLHCEPKQLTPFAFEKKRLGERQRTVSFCEIQSGGGLKIPTQAKALLQKGIFWDNEDSF